jgi:hypothetical protein
VVGFSDVQIKMIVEGATPLYPADRSPFLEAVVEALLQGESAVGNADLRAAIARAQREFR